MNHTEPLTTLYKHHLWANLRLLERCADLSEEQMKAGIPGSSGSIHETLEHIAIAERSYFARIRGCVPAAARHPARRPAPSLPQVSRRHRTRRPSSFVVRPCSFALSPGRL